ncbi:phosphoribosyltransferase family protein [Phytohalomonas tamaricis]|uniref:phosphoribosyltransferase family protein n=1 Tax=Phytohalomonas tamaricis TaxID=2081032 RepID=UPI000D0B4CED|nr:phosphoribosyltransferase family protein [Phytohalomonas tamaricis]
MNYRSLHDLSCLSTWFSSKVTRDVDLIVGIPRSGMLCASIISLKMNLPVIDLYSFLRNDEVKRGSTRAYKNAELVTPWSAKRILLVDDSIDSGGSIEAAYAKVKEVFHGEIVTMAAFAHSGNKHKVDFFFELVEHPRVFEWNIMHHPIMSESCLDIDGVLCEDPTPEENDDSHRYINFLSSTKPLFIPTVKVGHLVTSRLEKYRAETEKWLQNQGVQYGKLHMLDLPTAEERRRLNMHHQFKASVYGNLPARLFVESEKAQAIAIMEATKKPVYCIETNEMYEHGKASSIKLNAKYGTQTLKDMLPPRLKNVLRGLKTKLKPAHH